LLSEAKKLDKQNMLKEQIAQETTFALA